MKTATLESYRASFIIDMRHAHEGADVIMNHLQEVIRALGGKVKAATDLGSKPFQRVLEKKYPAGQYIQIGFDGETGVDFNTQLKNKLRLDQRVHRIFLEKTK